MTQLCNSTLMHGTISLPKGPLNSYGIILGPVWKLARNRFIEWQCHLQLPCQGQTKWVLHPWIQWIPQQMLPRYWKSMSAQFGEIALGLVQFWSPVHKQPWSKAWSRLSGWWQEQSLELPKLPWRCHSTGSSALFPLLIFSKWTSICSLRYWGPIPLVFEWLGLA